MTLRAAARHQLDSMLADTPLVLLWSSVLASASGLLAILAAAFAARRLAGYWTQPLSSPTLLLVGLVVVMVVCGLRIGWWMLGRWSSSGAATAANVGWWVVGSFTLLGVAIAVSIAGTSPLGLTLFWVLLAATEAAAWYGRHHWRGLMFDSHPRVLSVPAATPVDDRTAGPEPPASAPSAAASAEPDLGEDVEDGQLLPPDVSQQITRSGAGAGDERVTGLLRGDFVAGQRSQSLHVAFCPVLAARPAVDAIQMAGPPCDLKVADVQAYGVRFDLRLPVAPASDKTILVYFEARAALANESLE